LPGSATGRRETILTDPISARPQAILQMPTPGWPPFLGAIFTAAFFLLLTFKLVVPALACGVIAIASLVRWAWDTDPGVSHPPVEIGGGITLPVYLTGPQSHSWWASVLVILVSASIFFAMIFSYLFLWTVSPEVWTSVPALPALSFAVVAAALLGLASASISFASRRLHAARASRIALALAPLFLFAAWVFEFAGQSNLSPSDSSYAASVYMFLSLQGFFVVVATLMCWYTLARSFSGLVDSIRRATFDNTMLLTHYTVAQGLIALALVHGFPRLIQ
jgi:cytochrome c oxidase subunit I+III